MSYVKLGTVSVLARFVNSNPLLDFLDNRIVVPFCVCDIPYCILVSLVFFQNDIAEPGAALIQTKWRNSRTVLPD
jgi:hypothetical protein